MKLIEEKDGKLQINDEKKRIEVYKIIDRISKYAKKNKQQIEKILNDQAEVTISLNFKPKS